MPLVSNTLLADIRRTMRERLFTSGSTATTTTPLQLAGAGCVFLIDVLEVSDLSPEDLVGDPDV